MKFIIAAIKPHEPEGVCEAPTGIGMRGMMVTETKGFGARSGHSETCRGAGCAVNFGPEIRIDIAVAAPIADQVTDAIAATARTGKTGDGKIFVLDLEQAVRARTGEMNQDAL